MEPCNFGRVTALEPDVLGWKEHEIGPWVVEEPVPYESTWDGGGTQYVISSSLPTWEISIMLYVNPICKYSIFYMQIFKTFFIMLSFILTPVGTH